MMISKFLGEIMKTQIIYEPAGKAAEYSPLAANLYAGCDHGCQYCYAPLATRKKPEAFFQSKPREGVIRKLADDISKMKSDTRNVLLCFTCDPYQQIDEKYKYTRKAIGMFNDNDINYTVLTKGGNRSRRDFDLLTERPDLSTYATTLVFTDEQYRKTIETGTAAPTQERIECLRDVHKLGIRTWVSLEPVYDPVQTMELVKQTHAFVDLFKVGKLNYQPEQHAIDWCKFGHDIVDLFESLGCNYYVKNDLKKCMEGNQ